MVNNFWSKQKKRDLSASLFLIRRISSSTPEAERRRQLEELLGLLRRRAVGRRDREMGEGGGAAQGRRPGRAVKAALRGWAMVGTFPMESTIQSRTRGSRLRPPISPPLRRGQKL